MASPGGYIQAALEQNPNAEGGAGAVSSNLFYLPGTSIDMSASPTMLDTLDELRGGFYASPNRGVAEYAPAGQLDSRCYPSIMGLLLHAACGGCVTTPGNGTVTDPDAVMVPTGAFRHVFSLRTSEIPQTFQLVYAPPAGGFWKSQGVGVDELAVKANAGSWDQSSKLVGLVHKPLADPALTPSYETPGPWRTGQCVLTWLTGSARTEDFDWSLKNSLKTEHQFGVSSLFPDSIIYDAALPVLGGSIPKRWLDAVDYEALTAGTTFAAKMKLMHAEDAATGYKHQLWVEMPACQYQAAKPDAITNERRNKASFDWEARYDTATSKWFTITLVNATPAYATYA